MAGIRRLPSIWRRRRQHQRDSGGRGGRTVNDDTTPVRLLGQLGHEVLCELPSFVTSGPDDESTRHLHDALVWLFKHHALLLDLGIQCMVSFSSECISYEGIDHLLDHGLG